MIIYKAIRCLFLFVFIVAFVFISFSRDCFASLATSALLNRFVLLNCFAAPEELTELLHVHEQWETAFEDADIEAAESVWSHEGDVMGIDPLGLKAVGWKAVRKNLENGFAFLGPSELVIWDVVVSAKGDKGSVTGEYILEGAFLNKTFKATELYRKENGLWKLYYDDALGNKPPLFPDDEAAIKLLVAKATWAYLAFDFPT